MVILIRNIKEEKKIEEEEKNEKTDMDFPI